MSSFVVHTVAGSPYARAVLATLIEKGSPFRLAPIAVGGQHTPAYRALHPFAKMPVLEHGPHRLYETQAILRYLDRVLPSPPLTPADPVEAARMDMILNIIDHYLFPGVADVIVFHRVIGPMLFGAAPDEAAITAALPAAHRVFAELERLITGDPYVFGDQPSLADLALGPHLELFSRTPEWTVLTQTRPRLARLEAVLGERDSFRRTGMEALRSAHPLTA